jgi:hypothetical protein
MGDPFIREKFIKERSAARKLAKEYFERAIDRAIPTGTRGS